MFNINIYAKSIVPCFVIMLLATGSVSGIEVSEKDHAEIDKLIEARQFNQLKKVMSAYIDHVPIKQDIVLQTIQKLVSKQELDVADSIASQAIAKQSDLLGFHVTRGQILMFKGKTIESNAEFSDYLNSNPNDKDVIALRVQNYLKLKDYDNARKDYSALIRLESDNPLWYLARGEVYLMQERYDEALHDFDKTLELDSENLRAMKAMEFARYKVFNDMSPEVQAENQTTK